MSKATEYEMAELHGVIARGLTEALKASESTDGAGVVSRVHAPAAYFMAGITLLKNNNITADSEANTDLAALQRALAEKRKLAKGRMSAAAIDAAASVLERDLGGFVQ